MFFKEWLKIQEIATGTNSVAVFARPVSIGMVKRTSIPLVGEDDKDKKKK